MRVFAVSAAPATKPAAAVNVVTEAHGFKLQRQQFVREYDSTVLLYKHEKTGEGSSVRKGEDGACASSRRPMKLPLSRGRGACAGLGRPVRGLRRYDLGA